jgi:hypothetical protein
MTDRTDRPSLAEIGTLNALTDLIVTARRQEQRASIRERMRLRSMIAQLDAARTRLVQDGDEYLEVAWSFLDAGREAVVALTLRLDNEWKERHGAHA